MLRTTVAAAIAVAAMFTNAFFQTASAEVKPGDLITYQNADKIRTLVSPGTLYKVNQGMSMKIVPTSRLDWPPPFKEATEKYSGQVRLSDDHRSLVGYVAGQPFPLIDANDPYVAQKIAWNNQFRPLPERFKHRTDAVDRIGSGSEPKNKRNLGHLCTSQARGRVWTLSRVTTLTLVEN